MKSQKRRDFVLAPNPEQANVYKQPSQDTSSEKAGVQ